MEIAFNWPAIFLSAAIPLIFGAFWYAKPVATIFGSYRGNRSHAPIAYVLCYVMGVPLAVVLTGIMSMHPEEYQFALHGLFHGCMLGIFVVLPVMLVHFLFEGDRPFLNMLYHILFWIISLGLIGMVIFGR